MRIEERWNDGQVCHVVFETFDYRRIRKILILPAGLERFEEVEAIVEKNFRQVQKIVNVEFLDDCLILKSI